MNQNGPKEEYPPDIQDVIDRFISGEIEEVDKPNVDFFAGVLGNKKPAIWDSDFHDDYESAKKAVDHIEEQRNWRV